LYAVAGIAIVVDWLWARALVVGDSSPQSVLEVRTTNALVVGDSSPQSALKVRTTNTALEAHTTNAAFACWVAPVAAWASLVLVMFFAADPYLWHDPVNRLSESLFFHADYAQSAHVREAGYPLWQPFVWLAGPVPWHPGVFLVAIDLFVTILALLGLPRLWKKQKVFALWLIIALGFLLVWLTKWPQYILILTAPLTLAAAEGFQACVWQPLVAWIRRLRADRPRQTGETNPRVPRREARRALPWLLPGLIALGLMALFPLIFQFAMALTDFNVVSIRDGLTGGVWREVWLGLTGQVQPANLVLSSNFVVLKEARDRGEIYYLPLVARAGSGSPKVNYAGANLLLGFLSGMGADVFVFDVLWTVLVVGLQTALGLGVALMLSQRGVRFKNVWRAIFILPWAIPEFVGALVWLHVFEPSNGWLSLALGTSLGWRDDPQQALVVLLIAALWMGFPLMMVAASAGLKMMPGEVADAAALDGATGWQKFRAITWPLLFPLLAPALIIRAIFAFNQFYLFYVMQAPYPLMSFATVSFFLFDATRGFGGQFAVSAAINIFTVILLIVFIVWLTRWSKAAEGVTYA
jgi:ABC-type sugar transport system permease subunit